ncbi:MAG: methionine--tRNA ligase subunit beta [Candidatus Marsarchaeota archaeon]|nr:methionine--tRNA ligase subunit beta [Candidatus Marsarchaeota archaeon]
MVTIDEFKNIDIRIGKVLEASPHETARNPMYVLKVDFGSEIGERTIVAGIRDRYAKGEIEGRKIACVVNLEPKSVAGVISNGMILAAESGETLSLLVPDREIDQGSRVH